MRRTVPYLACAALGVALAFLASAFLTYRLSTTKTLGASAGAALTPAVAPPAPIAGENLYGALLDLDRPAPAAAAPFTPRRKLLLMGVMLIGPRSSAIIKDVTTDTIQLVRVGQNVFDDAEKLMRVDPFSAVLAGASGRRRLELGVVCEDTAPPPAAVAAPRGDGMTVSRAELRASVKSSEEILGRSKIVPEMRDNAIIGFKVNEVEAGSVIRKMGIQAGDIITSVNGQRLDSLERATGIWQKMKSESEIHMTVERNSEIKTLSYYVKP